MSQRPKRPEFQRNGRHFDNPEDLVGSQVGWLRVVAFTRKVPKGSRNTYYYKCLCACGQEVELTRWKLITKHTGSCGCRKNRKGANAPSWRGYEEIGSKFWSDIATRARKKELEFTLSIEEAWQLFQGQGARCALSGLPLTMTDQWDNKARKYVGTRTASLDRIDNTKGYTLENVHWVHKDINQMKSDLTVGDFIRYCRHVAGHQGSGT